MQNGQQPTRQRTRSWTRRLAAIAAAVGLEALATRARSGRLGGELVVRCRRGHLFTTLWIPGASVKSLRLGPWRMQYCPAGRHWSVVSPVREAGLSARERLAARRVHDVRVP